MHARITFLNRASERGCNRVGFTRCRVLFGLESLEVCKRSSTYASALLPIHVFTFKPCEKCTFLGLAGLCFRVPGFQRHDFVAIGLNGIFFAFSGVIWSNANRRHEVKQVVIVKKFLPLFGTFLLPIGLLLPFLAYESSFARSASPDSAKPSNSLVAFDKPITMDVGGYVSGDYFGQTIKSVSPAMSLGLSEVDATVCVGGNGAASVAVKIHPNLDSFSLYQATVQCKSAGLPLLFLFGQQTFNHGLATTRLISDPLIVSDVELVAPGVSLLYPAGIFLPCASFVVGQHPAAADSARKIPDYRCVVGLDMSLPHKSILRVSSLVSQYQCDVDGAFSLNFWNLGIDGELYSQLFGSDSTKNPAGYYLGVQLGGLKCVGIAARYDGRSPDRFVHLDQRICGGLVLNFKENVYCAAELSYVKPGGPSAGSYREVRLEVGLRKRVQLSGFHRRTLARI